MIKRLFLLLALLCSQPLLANPVDLELTDIEGNQLKLSDYRGKWVVLNYWATWCPPCLEEIPELVHYHESHKDSDGVVIGIDMEMLQAEALEQFVDDNFMTYPVVPMVENMPAFDNVNNFPTTYLIDPDGIAVVKHVGAITSDAIEQFIESYVPDKSVKR
ncbi:MAG: TlpA disulfide reductase family protein [Pseudomonadota bacterium]